MQLLEGLPTCSIDELAHFGEFSLRSICFPFLLPVLISFSFWWTAKCACFAALNIVPLHPYPLLLASLTYLHCWIRLLPWRYGFLYFSLHLPLPGNCQDLQLNWPIFNLSQTLIILVFFFLLSWVHLKLFYCQKLISLKGNLKCLQFYCIWHLLGMGHIWFLP